MAEYTELERKGLIETGRTNYQNLSKSDILTVVSKLDQMPKEVAMATLEKYPELTAAIKELMVQYHDSLTEIVKSDDKSLEHVYQIIQEDQNLSNSIGQKYFEMAENVCSDISKCLNNSNLSSEERKEMLDREERILKMVGEKETEIRNSNSNASRMASEKDTEKRKYDWSTLRDAAAVTLIFATVCVSFLGGNLSIKLPKGNNKI